MSANTGLSLLLSAALVTLNPGATAGQSGAVAPQAQHQPEGQRKPDLGTVAGSLLMISSRPGGIAIASGCDQIDAAPLDSAFNIDEALTQVSSGAAGYRVVNSGEAVDLLPPEGVTDGLLATKVPKFDYDGQRYGIAGAIQAIANVRDAMNRLGPDTVNSQPIPEPKIPPPPIHVHLVDTDLLGVLNSAAVAEHGGIWLLRFRRCGTVRTVNLMFLYSGHG